MKKKLAMLMAMGLTLSTVAAGFTGCGGSEGGDTTTKAPETTVAPEETEEPIDLANVDFMFGDTLTIGVEIGYPPFEQFADDGVTPIGFDIDLMTEIGQELGVEINFVNTAWDGIFEGIDVNYDVVCSAVTINEERKETMLFTTPYINNYQCVVLPEGSTLEIDSFLDLAGMDIAVQKETTSDILMSDYKDTGSLDANLVQNEKVTTCFTQLSNGEVDAVVVDSTVAVGYLGSNPGKYMIAFQDEAEPEQFGIAMGLENTALQAVLNEALARMEEKGTIDDIFDYWFGAAE